MTYEGPPEMRNSTENSANDNEKPNFDIEDLFASVFSSTEKEFRESDPEIKLDLEEHLNWIKIEKGCLVFSIKDIDQKDEAGKIAFDAIKEFLESENEGWKMSGQTFTRGGYFEKEGVPPLVVTFVDDGEYLNTFRFLFDNRPIND